MTTMAHGTARRVFAAVSTLMLSVTALQAAGLQVHISATDAEPAIAGFRIANDGQEPLTGLRLVGDGGRARCDAQTVQGHAFALQGTLAAGDSVGCRLDTSGAGRHSVAVVGLDSLGQRVVRAVRFDVRGVLTPAQGALVLLAGVSHDDGNGDGLLDAGETLDYHYTVVNVGTLDVSGLGMIDIDGAVACPQTTLAVDAIMTCMGSHAITAAEDAVGEVVNVVDIVGTDADGGEAQAGDLVLSLDLGGDAGIAVAKSPLLLDDADGNGAASVGDRLRYTFIAKNTNLQALSSVDLVEPDPSLIDTPITCSGTTFDGEAFAGLGTGTLLSHDAVSCTAEYTIQAGDATNGAAHNLVEASGQPAIGPAVFATGASTVVIPTGAAVTLAKTLVAEDGGQPGIAEPGETLTYAITLSNAGGSNAVGYGVTDVLDANTTFVSADNGGVHAAGIVTWTGLTVPAGGTLVLTVQVSVSDPLPQGTTQITNVAYPTGETPPTCPPAGESCVVTPTVGAVGLVKTVTDDDGDGFASPGEVLTYTITLSNAGGSDVDDYALTDALDPNTVFVSADNGGVHAAGTVTWTGLIVPAGGGLVLTVVVTVADPVPAGVVRILNVAHATGTTPPDCGIDPVPAGCADLPVLQEPQLAVVKTVSVGNASPGDTVTYTVTVSNVGPVDVTGMMVSDPVPAGIVDFAWTCIGTGGAVCANDSGTGGIAETIPVFPSGGELVYTVSAQLTSNPPETVMNVATVSPDEITTCQPEGTPAPCAADIDVDVSGEPPIPPAARPVPVDGKWMLLALVIMMAGLGQWRMRRFQS